MPKYVGLVVEVTMLFPLGLEILLESSAGLDRTVARLEGVGAVPTPHSPRLPFGN